MGTVGPVGEAGATVGDLVGVVVVVMVGGLVGVVVVVMVGGLVGAMVVVGDAALVGAADGTRVGDTVGTRVGSVDGLAVVASTSNIRRRRLAGTVATLVMSISLAETPLPTDFATVCLNAV